MEIKWAKPTKTHRLALAPGILGTVYGINDRGEAKYFDYDMEAAKAYAGVTADVDPRKWPADGMYRHVYTGATEAEPKPGAKCIWVLRDESNK